MNTGDTAWMLMSTALVLFMTPGLAFFYGGMVRSKNVLGMLMQNIFAMGILAILIVFAAGALACRRSDDMEALVEATREEHPGYRDWDIRELTR